MGIRSTDDGGNPAQVQCRVTSTLWVKARLWPELFPRAAPQPLANTIRRGSSAKTGPTLEINLTTENLEQQQRLQTLDASREDDGLGGVHGFLVQSCEPSTTLRAQRHQPP